MGFEFHINIHFMIFTNFGYLNRRKNDRDGTFVYGKCPHYFIVKYIICELKRNLLPVTVLLKFGFGVILNEPWFL